MRQKLGTNSGRSKIKNATKCEYDGVKFKSRLELFCYKELKKINISPGYECSKTVLLDKFVPKTFVFEPNKSGNIEINSKYVREMTYTPDFFFRVETSWIIIETKGFSRDTYNLVIYFHPNYDTTYLF